MSRLVRSRERARTAALLVEVVALRTTVIQVRAALAEAEAAATRLGAELAAAREPAPVAGPTLELPLVRLALQREAEPPLSREMALALVAVDDTADTATTDIVLVDLPEHPLLHPMTDRDSEPVDHAAGDGRVTDQPARRTA